MNAAIRVAAVVVALVLLGACGHSTDNRDPRNGRVTTGKSNCWSGGCYWDWKVCIGPDLLVHVNDHDHTLKNSAECGQS